MIALQTRRLLLLAAFAWLILAMFLLPIWSFPGYSLARNTTSHLGAQGSPHAWVMNLTFISIAVTSFLAVEGKVARYPFHLLAMAVFSGSLLLVGIFQHEPLVAGISTNDREATLHSLFATMTGFAFTLLAIATAFISETRRDRLLAIGVAIAATALSGVRAIFPGAMGIFQRLIFLIAFAWLLYLTSPSYQLR
jgi:hypothetical membrane protein